MEMLTNILQNLSTITWYPTSTILLGSISIFGYIIIIGIGIIIHRKTLSIQKRNYKNSITLYDTIRYEVAKQQYLHPSSTSHQGILRIFQESNPQYNRLHSIIKEEITAIEDSIQQKIISEQQRNELEKINKKYQKYTKLQNIIWRILTILTVGIYKLFR